VSSLPVSSVNEQHTYLPGDQHVQDESSDIPWQPASAAARIYSAAELVSAGNYSDPERRRVLSALTENINTQQGMTRKSHDICNTVDISLQS